MNEIWKPFEDLGHYKESEFGAKVIEKIQDVTCSLHDISTV
jgi:hypothetical protein